MAESSDMYRNSCLLIRRQLGWRLYALFFLKTLAAGLFLSGSLVLLARYLYGPGLGLAGFCVCFLPVVPCPAAAWILLRRSRPSEEAVRSLLDRRLGCGGILLSGLDRSTQDWESESTATRIRSVGLSLVKLEWRGAAILILLASAFAALSLIVPVEPTGTIAVADARRLDLSGETRRLGEKVEVLRQQEALSAQQAKECLEQLQRIADKALGCGPAEAFEALDSLENRMNQKAMEQAEKLGSQAQALDQAKSLADAMKNQLKGSAELSQALETLLKESLARLGAPELAKAQDGSGKSQDGSFESDPKSGVGPNDSDVNSEAGSDSGQNPFDAESNLSQEQLDKIQDWLNQQGKDLSRQWDDLQQLSIDELSEMDCPLGDFEMLPEDWQELQAELSAGDLQAGDCDTDDCEEALRIALAKRCGRGGSGGITRGRGDAPLTLNPETPEGDPVELKKERLNSPLSRQALQESRLRGVQRANPEQAGPGRNDAQGSVLQNPGGADGAGNAPLIYPEHRRVVEEYFK